jgi:hypothetical protein
MLKKAIGAIIVAILIGLNIPTLSQNKAPKRNVIIKMRSGELKGGKLVQADNDILEIEMIGKGRTTIPTEDIESVVFIRSSKPNTAYSSESIKAAGVAIQSLYTLMTAIQVGINRRDYGNRLVDVKITVQGALTNLPDGELKKALSNSLSMYEQGAQMWDLYLSSNSLTTKQVMYDFWDTAKKQLIRAAELFDQISDAPK